ncbi:MAG: cupin domain-containing protein [Alphaproteobacteria bacterium]|nr:cupin domain-containing protein [Alphaproteobacteria bacterium]
MRIKKKSHETFKREDAHGGAGGRKLLLGDREIANIQGMTHGFLPGGGKFALHSHEGMNEAMYVLKGHGVVRDEDGEYPYAPGDLFVFEKNILHEIENSSSEEHEYIFVRIYE